VRITDGLKSDNTEDKETYTQRNQEYIGLRIHGTFVTLDWDLHIIEMTLILTNLQNLPENDTTNHQNGELRCFYHH
jgi:hypothetical protein